MPSNLLALVSGGKDSWYSLYTMFQQGFEIKTTVTFVPKNEDSYMLHSINTELVKIQSELASIKNYTFAVSGKKEEEVEEIKKCIKKIVQDRKVEGIVCGAVKSEYQKHRIDMICEELGLTSYSPLWHKNEEKLLKEIVQAGFEFLITQAAEGIDSWVGKIINEDNVEDFIKSLKELKANLSGEGGEYETLVVSSPMFKKKIVLKKYKVLKDNLIKKLIVEEVEVKN